MGYEPLQLSMGLKLTRGRCYFGYERPFPVVGAAIAFFMIVGIFNDI